VVLGERSGSVVTSGVTSASAEGVYSTSFLCRKQHCINPIFPGVSDFAQLGNTKWVASSQKAVKPYLNFCKAPVSYDPSLPSPSNSAGAPITMLVQKQEAAAITAYFYHLAGMGLEGWEHHDPSKSSDCVQTVWRMACFTYFPRAQSGLSEGQASPYIRPCSSCCQNYVERCGVQCCDGSAMCVNGTSSFIEGSGPSALCTGAARHGHSPHLVLLGLMFLVQAVANGLVDSVSLPQLPFPNLRKVPLLAVVALSAVSLQGCNIPSNTVPAWARQPNYLTEFQFLKPGMPESEAVINSCNPRAKSVPSEQCGGHGYCSAWNPQGEYDATDAALYAGVPWYPIGFCQCDPEWADPECLTKRKSQSVVFGLAVFLGPVGADWIYLGLPYIGAAKLFVSFLSLVIAFYKPDIGVPALSFWWVLDIVRTGSAPVLAKNYRVADDMKSWVYIVGFISFMTFMGFLLALVSAGLHHKNRFRKQLDRLRKGEAYGATPFQHGYHM